MQQPKMINNYSCARNSPWNQLNLRLSPWKVRLLLTLFINFILLYAYWPGGLFSDSLTQLEQARSGQFDDWHPPVMAWLWSKMLIFGKDSSLYLQACPMLLFHLGMLSAATFLMSCYKNKSGFFAWYWIFFPLLPQVVGHAGLLVKDTGMAFALFLTFALIHVASSRTNLFERILLCSASLPFFMYALLVRHNAILAIPPIIYYSVLIFFHKINRLFLFISTVVICILLIIFSHLMNYHFFAAKKSDIHRVMYIDRICVASHYTKGNLFTVTPYSEYKYNDLPKDYKIGKSWNFYADIPVDYFELKKNYYNVILYHPVAYFLGKLRRICQFIFISKPENMSYENRKILPFYFCSFNSTEQNFRNNIMFKIFKYYVLDFFYAAYEFIFTKVFIISIGALLLFIAIGKNNILSYKIKMLTSSGILYFFSYILVTVFPDYRFTYWTFIAILISFFLIFENILHSILTRIKIFEESR